MGGEEQWRRVRGGLAGAMAAGLLVAVPLRSVQVESTVAPYANALAHIRAQTSDLVFVDKFDIGWGLDLVRNDPFLETKPVVLAAGYLKADALRQVCRGRTAVLFDHDNMARFGVVKVPREPDEREASKAEIRRNLVAAGCSLVAARR